MCEESYTYTTSWSRCANHCPEWAPRRGYDGDRPAGCSQRVSPPRPAGPRTLGSREGVFCS